jgi:hypothetical protein
MTQEFLERTDTAGNIIYTSKTGEKLNMETTPEKNKDVVATMTFPSEQLIEMFKDYTMTGEQVEELIAGEARLHLGIHCTVMLQDPGAHIQLQHGIPDPGFFTEGFEGMGRFRHGLQRFAKPRFVNADDKE